MGRYQASYQDTGTLMDFTPGANIEAGEVVVVSDVLGIATQPITAGHLGSLRISGVFKVQKTDAAISQGEDVVWDADATPKDGSATLGAVKAGPGGAGDQTFGVAVEDDSGNEKDMIACLLLQPTVGS